MKPHKHSEIIKAWADGAEIQMYRPENDSWNYINNPSWFPSIQYRVKPEPKPDIVRYVRAAPDFVASCNTKKEYSNNLLLTWDGETGKLKSAEVI